MKTQKQIEKKIKSLKAEDYSYQMNGGGWVDRPNPYTIQIELLEWVLKEDTEGKILITYDNGRKGYIKEKYLSECPKCQKKSVRGKEMFEGGGVCCITPKCGYWFCA